MTPRVLVLERNADLRILLASMLRHAGYECDVAAGDALDQVRQDPTGTRRRRPAPAVVVLGLPPGRAAGLAMSRAAKARWPGIPLVVLVSDPGSGLRDSHLAAGAGAVLCRPLGLHVLGDTIDRLLGDGPASPARRLSAEEPRPRPKRILIAIGDAADRRRLSRKHSTRSARRAG
ncbi:MAG TPA: response regulator [Thermodesulfobacteriota bacterium]